MGTKALNVVGEGTNFSLDLFSGGAKIQRLRLLVNKIKNMRNTPENLNSQDNGGVNVFKEKFLTLIKEKIDKGEEFTDEKLISATAKDFELKSEFIPSIGALEKAIKDEILNLKTSKLLYGYAQGDVWKKDPKNYSEPTIANIFVKEIKKVDDGLAPIIKNLFGGFSISCDKNDNVIARGIKDDKVQLNLGSRAAILSGYNDSAANIFQIEASISGAIKKELCNSPAEIISDKSVKYLGKEWDIRVGAKFGFGQCTRIDTSFEPTTYEESQGLAGKHFGIDVVKEGQGEYSSQQRAVPITPEEAINILKDNLSRIDTSITGDFHAVEKIIDEKK